MADDELIWRECLAVLAAPSPASALEPALLPSGAEADPQHLLDALYEPLMHSALPAASSQSALLSPSSPHVTKPSGPSRNSTREKMQRELRQLRAQCAALEHALKATQSRKSQQQQQPQSCVMLLATWKYIAERQLEQRRRAEAENAQLKRKIESNLTISRAFQQSVGDWMACSGMLDYAASPHQITLRSTVFADPRDFHIYETLVSQLGTAAAQMDAVFQENGLSQWQLDSPSSSVQMKTRYSETSDAMYIEFLDVDVLPFPKHTVFNASWQRWEQRSLSKNSDVYANLQHAGDLFASKSCCEIYLSEDSSISIALEFLSVTKAFRYDDRIVYVWRGITKSDSQFPGAYVDETGWQVVRAIGKRDGDEAFENGSVVLTCTQLEPKCNQAFDELQAQSLAPLANLVISAYKVDMQEVSDLMMTLLLQHPTS